MIRDDFSRLVLKVSVVNTETLIKPRHFIPHKLFGDEALCGETL